MKAPHLDSLGPLFLFWLSVLAHIASLPPLHSVIASSGAQQTQSHPGREPPGRNLRGEEISEVLLMELSPQSFRYESAFDSVSPRNRLWGLLPDLWRIHMGDCGEPEGD